MASVITLLTDFGLKDFFAASMKGVVLSINPNARVVDISHDVPAWDVKAAAFVLHAAYRYFPEGTIHVCVVDPEVGSSREILLVETEKYLFLAPDNGLLSCIFEEHPYAGVYRVNNPIKYLPEVSSTFHGRDIFAPVAAHLSLGTGVREIGEPFTQYMKRLFPRPEISQGAISGEIVYNDGFGNLITNVTRQHLNEAGIFSDAMLTICGTEIRGIRTSYSEVPVGELLMLFSSGGFLEIGCYQSSAAQKLGADVEDKIELSRP